MDKIVLAVKLESLVRCLNRIEEKRPSSVHELSSDYDIQDIILINIERAVQQMVDAALIVLADYSSSRPETMAESFRELARNGVIDDALGENLARSVGFRNIAVHEYQKLNWDIVWSIITERVLDFKSFIEKLSVFL